ncbi:hypothetical protein ACU4GR_24150 [Methylobacterium oryzae CBMB20]
MSESTASSTLPFLSGGERMGARMRDHDLVDLAARLAGKLAAGPVRP